MTVPVLIIPANTNSWAAINHDIDLSGYVGQAVYLGIGSAMYIENYYDHGYVEFSNNSGSTWTSIFDFSGYAYYWNSYSWLIPDAYKTAHFRVRFHLTSDSIVNHEGWLIDNVGIGLANTYYAAWDGTSMATPHVAGAVALMAAQFPSENVAARIYRILSTVDANTSLVGKCVTAGRLNLFNAISYSAPAITVTSPNGGESWTVGTGQNITWTSTGFIANVRIEYSTTNGSAWNDVIASTTNDGSHPWTIPNSPSSQCLVRISDAAVPATVDSSNANFSIVAISTFSISGTVLVGGSPLAGVVMNGLTGSPTTNASGVYTGTVTSGWSGTVTPTLAGYTFSPANRTYSNVTANQTAQDYTATLLIYTISGTILAGGSPLAGVVMSGLSGNPTTNASGVYTGTVAYNWSGTVTPTLAGYTFSPVNRTYTNVTANQTSQDYTATLLTYTISGTVLAGGSPLAGVVMSGLTGNPTTNASGVYSGTVTYNWSGTATPTLAGYTFTPASRTYANVVANQSSQDYSAELGCTFVIDPTSTNVAVGGGTGSVSVTAGAGCGWTATSNDPSWLTVTSGSPGSGNGTLGYSVAANTGDARTGTITIAGQTFTVNQAGLSPFADIGAGLTGVTDRLRGVGRLRQRRRPGHPAHGLHRLRPCREGVPEQRGGCLHGHRRGADGGRRGSSVAWGDYDNDGDLDILLTGTTGSGGVAKVYRNDGGGCVHGHRRRADGCRRRVRWRGGTTTTTATWTSCSRVPRARSDVAKVYRNDGAGVFTDIAAGLTGVYRRFGGVGDYDNDGDLDILLTGTSGYGYVAKVYRNDGGGVFTDIGAGLTGRLQLGGVGRLRQRRRPGHPAHGPYRLRRTSRRCTGTTAEGVFTDIGAGLTGVYCELCGVGRLRQRRRPGHPAHGHHRLRLVSRRCTGTTAAVSSPTSARG